MEALRLRRPPLSSTFSSHPPPQGVPLRARRDSANTIRNDLTNEKPIWPYTCYGPSKGEPNLISGQDVSFEELRAEFVKARQANNPSQYVGPEQCRQLDKLTRLEARRLPAAEGQYGLQQCTEQPGSGRQFCTQSEQEGSCCSFYNTIRLRQQRHALWRSSKDLWQSICVRFC